MQVASTYMYFDSLENFFYMDGHGIYVWAVVTIAFVVVSALVALPVIKRRQFVKEELRLMRRNAANPDSEVA